MSMRTVIVAAAIGVAGGALLAFASSLGRAVPGIQEPHRVSELQAQTAPQPPPRAP